MQTLVSTFDDRARARRAMEQLIADGFDRDDVHLHEASASTTTSRGDAVNERSTGEHDHSFTGEREVALSPHMLEQVSNFFVRLFGHDRPEHNAYTEAMKKGHVCVIVDAQNDERAEHAATVLHHYGAVSCHDTLEGHNPERPGVRMYDRTSQPPLREVVGMSQVEGANHS